MIRAIKYSIAAEYEAIHLYMQLAESIDNELTQAVLKDIADEERTYACEFLRLLKELSPNEEKIYNQKFGTSSLKNERFVVELRVSRLVLPQAGSPDDSRNSTIP